MNTIPIYAKINPSSIGFLNSIIDSYEGMALMRTVEAKEGKILFLVSPDFKDDFDEMIKSLKKEFSLILEVQ